MTLWQSLSFPMNCVQKIAVMRASGSENERDGVRYRSLLTANGMRETRNLISLSKTIVKPLALLALWLLIAPAGSVSAQSPTSNHYFEVPFQLIHNQIVLEVKIGGKGPFTMLLDTDTDPSAIDLITARDLELAMGSKAHSVSGGGTEANLTFLTRIPLVEIGSLSAKNIAAAAIDLKKLSARLGKPVHGVLGYSFLKDRIVQIDYPAGKLRFYDANPYPGIQNAPNMVNRIALGFRYDGDVIIDNVFINGRKMRATIDTGSSNTLCLTPEAIAILGLDEDVKNARVDTSVGYNGEYEERTGILKSVRIGRLSLESVQATFWLPGTGHDQKRFQVNIGNDFLKDFVVTFDSPGKLVILETP